MSDHDNRDDIVQGPPRRRWRWSRGERLDLGDLPRSGGTVEGPPPPRLPRLPRLRLPRPVPRPAGARRKPAARRAGGPAEWKTLAINLVVGAAFLFHALPQLVRMGGTVGMVDARGMVVDLIGVVPVVAGFDIAQVLVPAVSGWLWQPLAVAFVGGVLRLFACNHAQKDPLQAIWIAAAATLLDLVTWLFIGLKLWGTAFTAVEGQALITLLKIEGAALFLLFCVMAPTGKKRLGQTDADWHGDN